MGDLTTNENGVLLGLEQVLSSRGIKLPPRSGFAQDAGTFKRIFPTPNGGILGNTVLGRAAVAAVGPGKRYDVPLSFTLTLDPEYTAPGSAYYVHFGDPSQSVIVRPGQTLEVPGGFRAFYFWDAVRQSISAVFSGSLIGYVAWLVGNAIGARPNFDAERTARGHAAIIGRGVLTTNAPSQTGAVQSDTPCVPTSGLKGLRVQVFPRDATPLPMAAPADMAGTIRPWTLSHTNGQNIANNDTIDAPLMSGVWIPGSVDDLAVSQFSRSFDVEVAPGSMLVYLQGVTVTLGTGVTDWMVFVEGY